MIGMFLGGALGSEYALIDHFNALEGYLVDDLFKF